MTEFDLNSRFLQTIEKYRMVPPKSSVAVGVSGGADSMTLLHLFAQNKDALQINRLVAAHLNHGLRGDDADRDQKAVEDFCRSLGVEFVTKKIFVGSICEETKENEEECGRRERYEFFSSLNTDLVATAHTLSDRTETMLFNIARGSSLSGLCSIPAKRDNIIRPLIDFTRDEIEQYCNSNSIEYVTDATNSDTEYSRNRIRCEVIPNFKKINPAFEKACDRLMTTVRAEEDFLNRIARKAMKNAEIKVGVYDAEKLRREDEVVAKRAICLICDDADSGYEAVHIDMIYRHLDAENYSISLPNKRYALINQNTLQVLEYRQKDFEIKLAEGRFETAEYFINIKKTVLNEEIGKNINNLFAYCILKCDKISDDAQIRNRRDGDNITLTKRRISKSLKKLFNEMKIPTAERDDIVIVADGEKVCWVQGIGYNEGYEPPKNNEEIYMISMEGKNA